MGRNQPQVPSFKKLEDILRPYQKEVVERAVAYILEKVHQRREKDRKHACVVVNAPTGTGKTLIGIGTVLKLCESGPYVSAVFVRTRNELSSFVRDTVRFIGYYPPVVLNKGDVCIIAETEHGELIKCKDCPYSHIPVREVNKIVNEEAVTVLGKEAYDPYKVAELLRKRGICPYVAMMNLNCIYRELYCMYIPWIVLTYPYLCSPWIARLVKPILDGVALRSDYKRIAIVDEAHNLEDSVLKTEAYINEDVLTHAEEELRWLRRALELSDSILRSVLEKVLIAEEDEEDAFILEEAQIKLVKDLDELLQLLPKIKTWVIQTIRRVKVEEKVVDPPDLEPGQVANSAQVAEKCAEIIFRYRLEQERQRDKKRRRIIVKTKTLARFLERLAEVYTNSELVIVLAEKKLEIRSLETERVGCVLSFYTASMLLSGTMPPEEYIRKVWGIEDILYLNVDISLGTVEKILIESVTTRYTERTDKMIHKIAKYLTRIWEKSDKVMLVVFPSYEMMLKVIDLINIPKEHIIIESKNTKIGDVIEQVKTNGGKVCICAVAGGKLTEGIEITDNEGRSLISDIVIVGIPYPKPTEYQNKLIDRIIGKTGLNKWYILNVKAWVKVRQALGRGIRHPDDHCRWWLLDRRYRQLLESNIFKI